MKKGLIGALVCFLALACFGQTQPFRWVDTWAYSGYGVTQTEPLRVWGKDWRLDYQVKGLAPFCVEFHDIVTGATRKLIKRTKKQDGMSGSVREDGPVKLAYLRVEAPVCQWGMRMSQYIDKPDEWQFMRWQSPRKQMLPFGSWGGEAGSRSFTLEVQEAMGEITLAQNGAGRVEVTVVDEAGVVVMNVVSLRKGRVSSWFYKPGVYSVTVNALEATWSLSVGTVVE